MRVQYFTQVLLIFALANTAAGNTYIFEPLERIPSEKDIHSFANFPPAERRTNKDMGITKDDFLRFVREGKISANSSEWPQGKKIFWFLDGVFFTKNGDGFYWKVQDEQSLYITSQDWKSCLVTVDKPFIKPFEQKYANSPDLPKAERPADIVGIFNGPRPGTGIMLELKKTEISKFISQAIVFTDSKKYTTLQGEGNVTLRTGEKVSTGFLVHAKGAFTTSEGRVYFWKLWNDHCLFIQAEDNRSCFYIKQ